MDLIDKINKLQSYSSLPFGELYKTSFIINEVSNFKVTHEYEYSNSFNNDITAGSMFSFSFEVNSCLIKDLSITNKNQIIIKHKDSYYLLKTITSVVINNNTYTLDRLFPSHNYHNYGFYNYHSNRAYIKNNNVIVTGYANEVLEEPIVDKLELAEQII